MLDITCISVNFETVGIFVVYIQGGQQQQNISYRTHEISFFPKSDYIFKVN